MLPFNSFYLLREEALKLWEHDFSDELMQFGEVFNPNIVPDNSTIKNNVILHLRGRWWEILRRHGNGDFYCAIIGSVLTHADLGLGGTFSLEKARLYLSMDAGVTTITKAKNWVNPERNPNQLKIKYKIANGCKFLITQDWHKDE